MPLSEHEQRLLEQMERALYAEDPKFATSLRSSRGGRGSRGRAALGVLVILAGLGLLVGGVATAFTPLGIFGFAAMLIGSVLVYSAFTGRGAVPASDEAPEGAADPATPGPPGPSRSSGFMDRMEDRWRKRNEDGQ